MSELSKKRIFSARLPVLLIFPTIVDSEGEPTNYFVYLVNNFSEEDYDFLNVVGNITEHRAVSISRFTNENQYTEIKTVDATDIGNEVSSGWVESTTMVINIQTGLLLSYTHQIKDDSNVLMNQLKIEFEGYVAPITDLIGAEIATVSLGFGNLMNLLIAALVILILAGGTIYFVFHNKTKNKNQN